MSKWSKQRKTTKLIKLRWIACIWRRIGKNFEFCHKTFKTTQNSKSDQNTMTWIDLMSNWQKCRVLSQNIQNNAKLQKWSKYNDFASIWCRIRKMSSFVTKHSKQSKTTKSIKLRWIACIWRRIGKNVEFCHKTFKTTQNSKSDQNTMTWIDLTSNWQKCRVLSQNIQNNAKLQKWSKYNDLNRFDVELAKMSSFVTKHSKHRKTPKVIKVQWLCIDLMSKWSKRKNAKLPKRSNDDELHAFDVELAKMSSFVTKHSKQRKTPKVIKVQWLCIDLMSKWSKQRKTPKVIKIQWLESIWCRIRKNVEFCHKTFKTTQNYQIDQITMNCMHLTSNWQKCRVLSQNIQNNAKLQKWSKYNDLDRFDVELAKMSSFVTKHSKQRKTPKVIKVQWLCIDLMSKWSKERKTTKAIKWRWIACIWRRIGKNVEFCHKTFKTTQNYQIDQITMNCMDLTSNWQKCRVLSQNIQNNAKHQKWSKYNDFASIWCQNIQNNAKLQKWSKYNDLNRFDVELAKMSSFVTKHSKQRKTPKVIKVQWLCIDLMSKWSKQRKTTKAIKWRWIACIWRRIGKNVEFCEKTFKTTQNSKSDQNTMTWIDLMSNWQKCRVLSQNIQNNAKLQKWSKYNDLNRFDVELAKMSSFVTKHSKQRKTPKVIKTQWLCIDLMSKWSKQRKTTKSIKPYDELHGFDVEMAKMSSFVTKHSKQRKTPKVIKVQWLCIDLMSKWSKQRKTTKLIKLRWIAWIWRRISKNVEFCHKTFKTP